MTNEEKTEENAGAGLRSFARGLSRLKRTRRQGWIDRDVANPESVADHSFRMALLAWVISGRAGLNRGRAIMLALVHDLAEAYAGDITPFGDLSGLSPTERRRVLQKAPERTVAEQQQWDRHKHARETEGLRVLLAGLHSQERAVLTALWTEYEEGQTAEAELVKQLDKVETWLQAQEYRAENPGVNVESFRKQIEGMPLTPLLRAIANADDT
ncbi:MAG TPA: HD domain-containing protein [Chloroflexota bacterium]|nr:HD domain-containing protein [Chloroflexota bacterium]